MTKVLMVGNAPTVKGGITTVINQFRNFDWNKKDIDLKFIPTYIDKNAIIKILYFIMAYVRIIFVCIFNKPDIIHIHMSYKGSFTRTYFIQKLAMKFKIKNIVHLHGSEFKKWYDTLDEKKKSKVRLLLYRSDKFIVLGNVWNDVIKNIEPNTKTIILKNSVKIPNVKVAFNDKKTLLFLGVLIKRKGAHDLIEALSRIKIKNYKLLIAGSGIEEANLKELVNKYNLNENVEFLGWVDFEGKSKLLANSQILVLPSYNEGLPMSILEAMSYGIPILSTNVGDISTVVINGKNGYLCNPGNVELLSEHLSTLINMQKEQWEVLSNNARETIIKEYSEDEYFKLVEEMYITK